jgi:protein CpxP
MAALPKLTTPTFIASLAPSKHRTVIFTTIPTRNCTRSTISYTGSDFMSALPVFEFSPIQAGQKRSRDGIECKNFSPFSPSSSQSPQQLCMEGKLKTKNSAKFALAALILATLVGGSYVLADGRYHHGRGADMRHFASELQLTENQRAQIRKILADSRETIRPLYRDLKEKKALFREAAGTEPFDEALTRYHAQELARVEAEVMVARAQRFNELRSVLTPEQKAKFVELRKERRRHLWERRKRHFRNPSTEG